MKVAVLLMVAELRRGGGVKCGGRKRAAVVRTKRMVVVEVLRRGAGMVVMLGTRWRLKMVQLWWPARLAAAAAVEGGHDG